VDTLLAAAERVRDAGFVKFDAFAPFPIHGLDEAMGIRTSRLPLVVLGGGVTGACAGLLLQWWTNAFDYRYLVSGKPYFGLPVAIPVTFELTVLLAAIGAFVGLVVANRLPELYHPVLHNAAFQARATTDGFFVAVEAGDPRFDVARTRSFLEGLGAVRVDELEDD
jgi:hypothetical protein